MLSRPRLYSPAVDLGPISSIARRRYDDFIEALRQMVSIDCGSFTPEGVNRVVDLCEARFESGGWKVERTAHQPARGEARLGDLLVGRLTGGGSSRQLLIGHTDTVFDDGTAAARPFRVDGHRALGPGVSDMKGGLLTGFFAIEVLQEAGFDGFGSVTFVCNPDEEIGSPFSGPVIRGLANEADYALVLEAARENGDIVSARKGVSDYRIDIVGRAAHAGVEPERGRNAILEAAHKIIALQELNGRWPGVTVNVGVIEGGTRPNVVAERCSLHVDVRSPVESSFAAAESEIDRICRTHTVADVEVTVDGHGWHRPMEKQEGGARMAAIATQVAADLGFELKDAATGGASDANTTSAAGVPTLDGLGPIGGDDHSPSEWLDLSSVVPRISLLAGLISRLEPA
jgi:glutamate carboxypeptidase